MVSCLGRKIGMENVLTISLWLLPVAGVLALSTQEFLEEKLSERRGRISWDQIMTWKEMILICQQDVCGCDNGFTAEDDDEIISAQANTSVGGTSDMSGEKIKEC